MVTGLLRVSSLKLTFICLLPLLVGGLIGEMGVFNKVLSDTERAGLINYVKAKWGI